MSMMATTGFATGLPANAPSPRRYSSASTPSKTWTIRISSARTRWGSCSSRGTLSFTYRLVMAPPDVVDYVVLHELVHTQIHNHSKTFWNKVAKLMPDYKPRLAWLKKNGKYLM